VKRFENWSEMSKFGSFRDSSTLARMQLMVMIVQPNFPDECMKSPTQHTIECKNYILPNTRPIELLNIVCDNQILCLCNTNRFYKSSIIDLVYLT